MDAAHLQCVTFFSKNFANFLVIKFFPECNTLGKFENELLICNEVFVGKVFEFEIGLNRILGLSAKLMEAVVKRRIDLRSPIKILFEMNVLFEEKESSFKELRSLFASKLLVVFKTSRSGARLESVCFK